MGDKQNPARTLIDRVRGVDWISSLPAKFRSALLYITYKTPGVNRSVMEDDLVDNIVSSKVTTDRTNERTKETTRLDAKVLDETIYHEQDYDEELDVIIPTDNYLTLSGDELGQSRRSIHGINPIYDEVKTISPDTSVLDNYHVAYPGVTNLQLPDILEGITASMDKSSADGTWTEAGGAAWAGAGSAAISFGGSAEGAAAIMPSLTIQISQPWTHNIPTANHLFFMLAPVTIAQMLARLTALIGSPVLAWPKFKPRIETVRLFGQDVKINVRVTSHWQDGGGCSSCGGDPFGTSEHSQGSGFGSSHSLGLTVKTVTIPPTIHGAITISGTTSDSITGNADASIGGGTIIAVSTSDSATAEASVVANITATANDHVIPTSGIRLLDLNVALYKYRYVKVIAEVVNFADL